MYDSVSLFVRLCYIAFLCYFLGYLFGIPAYYLSDIILDIILYYTVGFTKISSGLDLIMARL
jgi:hypothetical protein